jgi:uncharacterized protein
MTTQLLSNIATAKCIALTTYRRDGSPVATPVWFHITGDKIFVTTEARTAKVNRIRNNPQVTYAVCTQGGKVTGPVFTGTASLLDATASAKVLADKKRRYFLQRILSLIPKFKNQVGIEITPTTVTS